VKKTNTKKISVIIPAYNAEPYIEKCLNSLIAQTEPNFEAIIIDDGSADNTFEICKKYAAQDARFKVIKQSNGGVSAARNSGLDIAGGEFITFVDSDDYVAPDYLQVLLQGYSGGEFDIAMCGYVLELDKSGELYRVTGNAEELTQTEILNRMFVPLNRSWGGFLVNKLFKAEIIKKNHIRLNPEYKLFEDIVFNYEYIKSVKRGSYTPAPAYYYVTRKNSAVCTSEATVSNANKWLNSLKAFDFVMEDAKDTYPQFCKILSIMKVMFSATALRIAAKSGLKATPRYKELRRYIIKNLGSFLASKNIRLKKKIGCILTLIMPKTAFKLWAEGS
jgi:glycosyltransferase involved in cell wall biosynthesis